MNKAINKAPFATTGSYTHYVAEVVIGRYDVIHEMGACGDVSATAITMETVAVPPRKRQRLHHAQTWSTDTEGAAKYCRL